jgi:glycogen debranching enzyme
MDKPPDNRPIHVDLPISAPGAFCYYVEHDSPTGESRISGRKGFFNVEPVINLPSRTPFFPSNTESTNQNPLEDSSSGAILEKNASLTMDGLTIISVLAKWMGKTSEWEKHFSEASRRGYNMLHWAPLQESGSSGSPYSILDQLRFDPSFLTNPDTKDGGFQEVEKILNLAKQKYGLGGITDVVLNHLAFDSPYLVEHPEAGEQTGSASTWTPG